MKNLYNEADKNEILNRLEDLKVDAVRQWGKMNIVQMLAHLNVSLETPLGKNFPKRAFIGRLIGKLVKKKKLLLLSYSTDLHAIKMSYFIRF